ncbi:ThiF family adenylyltransferase [Microbacterium invictum]|uniref:Adenylyltransferase/sulfurtransferase n=1 Tax=Microbacterium invictum TaxID=515415 RepID=A0AA40SLD4_9MICO|nr:MULTISPECIES: ThiF family adenylyltransferase [Microbacterium]MBB4138371.1 adenylyltransferase/sulfurtransferase [Microbacterium invictum]
MPLAPLVEPVAALSPAERERTLRHATLAGFGEIGQRRLAAAHVAVIGAGGLGSPVILALAAAGVGTLTVIDDDIVEATNLHRQILHRHADIGAAKLDSAVRAAADLSPETVVHAVPTRLTGDNAAGLLAGADLVVDGSDTFATRTDVAAACEALGIALVWGVLQEFHAQVTVFWSAPPAGTTPVRLRDLYPPGSIGEPPSCSAVGVLGALCLQVGGMLATEAIKLITGIGEPLLGRVAVIDSLRGTQREIPLAPAAITEPRLDAMTPEPTLEIPQLTAEEMLAAQAAGATLLDVREPFETATGIVAESVVIPLADFFADPGQVEGDQVVVICAHGVRAQRAAEVLRARGVEASVLAGGLAAWAS